MKNLQCDICSKQFQSKFQLENLRKVYQTENVAQICEDCLYVVDKQLYKIQNKCWNGKLPVGDISKELKEYINGLRHLDIGVTENKVKAEEFWSKVWKGFWKKI